VRLLNSCAGTFEDGPLWAGLSGDGLTTPDAEGHEEDEVSPDVLHLAPGQNLDKSHQSQMA
jgi:hypothetical protein